MTVAQAAVKFPTPPVAKPRMLIAHTFHRLKSEHADFPSSLWDGCFSSPQALSTFGLTLQHDISQHQHQRDGADLAKQESS